MVKRASFFKKERTSEERKRERFGRKMKKMVKKKKKILKKTQKRKLREKNSKKKNIVRKIRVKKEAKKPLVEKQKLQGETNLEEKEAIEEEKLPPQKRASQVNKLAWMPPIRSSEEMKKKAGSVKKPTIKEIIPKTQKLEAPVALAEERETEEKKEHNGFFSFIKKPLESLKENEEISKKKEEAEEEPEERAVSEERELPEEMSREREKEKEMFLHKINALSPITPTENQLSQMMREREESPAIPIQQDIHAIKEEKPKIEERIKVEIIGKKEAGRVLEKYSIEIDKAKVKVEIEKGDSGIIYNLYVPEIGVATASLLEDVRNELVSVTTISMQEILDPAALKDIKKRFMQVADELIKKKLPTIKPDVEEFLIGKLMQDMLGLGEIEFLVNDPGLEEVVIPTSKEPIRVYHKKYGWLLSNLRIAKESEIVNYSNIIARRVGRQITVLTPLLDAHLVTGDRVNAVLYPISTKGNTITIRKFARDPYTIIDLINNKTCNLEIAALLWLAVEYEMNLLISGGTASGKTVLLNACMPFIPPNHRIVSVEDTRELMLPDFLYWTPLITRTANPEGKGEVNMLDLLVNSLRMRPDRIVLGEMRRKEEAMVLFEAMHTGHSVYATVHADSAAETISRLTNPPLSVPPNLLRAVNLNAVMFRDRRRGIRRVSQVAEFQTSENRAEANIIYRLIPEEDKIIRHSESSRFFEDLSRNTGMTQAEINKNLEGKQKILAWMIKNSIRDLNDLGKVMNIYYTNKEKLNKLIQRNDIKGVLGR